MPAHAEHRRRQAVTRYLDGDKIDDICKQMRCSKSWLYTWKNRYQPDDPAWAQAQSRRPRTQAARTPESLEQAVIELRQTLGQSGQPGGAVAIQQALRQQGLEPIPSPRTIYRILERNGKKEHATHSPFKGSHYRRTWQAMRGYAFLPTSPLKSNAHTREEDRYVKHLLTPTGHPVTHRNPCVAALRWAVAA